MISMLAAMAISEKATPPVDGISISILAPAQVPAAARVKNTPTFYVQFKNSAKKPRVLLQEGCSWGYEMVSFVWTGKDRVDHPIPRTPRGWDKNYPMPWPIEPGKSAYRAVYLTDGTWTNVPTGQGKVRLNAILEIKKDGILDEMTFWFGRAVSKPYPVEL